MLSSQLKVLIPIAVLAVLLVSVLSDDQEIFLESKESKSSAGGPIYNKIKWFSSAEKDIWMMNQSHHGINSNSWDRLAIVVDKTRTPKTARYYQFEPGPLEWNEQLKERSFKVSCFLCHNNGPRVIRPNNESLFNPTSIKEKFKIFYWNLRIKSYGRVVADPIHDEKDLHELPPFRFQGKYENDILKVKTCVKCHKEDGFLARGFLKRQQKPTIQFMIESGTMPPFGYKLAEAEKRELERFLLGL